MHTVLHRAPSLPSFQSLYPALKNSVRKETSLFVLLNVFLFDCSSIISSHGNSRGTKREAEAMFSKHKLRAGSVFETARLGSHLSALL